MTPKDERFGRGIGIDVDTESDIKEHLEKGGKGVSHSVRIVQIAKANPNRAMVILDFVDQAGGAYDTVKRTLIRLSTSGKGSGPIKRVARGLYQYAPEKENDTLTALVRSGNWKIENLVFKKSVPSGVYPTPVSLFRDPEISTNGTHTNYTKSRPHPNNPYPNKLPTGHTVSWDIYSNGTEIIRISAKGAPPLNPDAVIVIIERLKECGMDDSWICISVELNVDSLKHRFDISYSRQLDVGLLIKAYQHGYNARIEIAHHQKSTLKEIIQVCNLINENLNANKTLRKIDKLENRFIRVEKKSNLAFNVATAERDGKPRRALKNGKKKPTSGFKRASENP